jgi:hypothetical protein
VPCHPKILGENDLTACLAPSGIPFDRMGTIRPYTGTNERGEGCPSWNSICNFLTFELDDVVCGSGSLIALLFWRTSFDSWIGRTW